jgi:two-component system NarL family sensor kinase
VLDLHPVVLEHGGLRAALGAVAQHQAGSGGFEVSVHVSPAAERQHERLLLSIVRELLSNVGRHAEARRAAVSVQRREDVLVLEVSDDGRGVDAVRARDAVARGHIGLASAAQRIEALGGRFELLPRAGGGTVVRAVIPVARPED